MRDSKTASFMLPSEKRIFMVHNTLTPLASLGFSSNMRIRNLIQLVAASGLAFSGYAPLPIPCPEKDTFIRAGDSISDQEAAWLQARHVKTDAAIEAYLERVGVPYPPELTLDSEKRHRPIKIGLGFSGGGLRALFVGAGEMAAIDNRTTLANENGLGGILQSASYIASLSGGAWLLASLIHQDWPPVEEVLFENSYNIWNYTAWNTFFVKSRPMELLHSLASGDYEEALTHVPWWNSPRGKGLKTDLKLKKNAGFPVSLTDAWGRLMAHSLFEKDSDNWLESATWAGIREIPAFANQDMPFPIITALARSKNSTKYDINSPVIEFNPYEMGSFGTAVNTFHDIRYLGTNVSNGKPQGECYTGFDNVAFVVGTSSSLFNQFLNTLVCPGCTQLNKIVKYVVEKFLKFVSRRLLDVAWYRPSPFYASEYAASRDIAESDTLYLMDGGLAGEVVPLSTLAVKERELDLVISFDNNGPEWPDGKSLVRTYEIQSTEEGASTVCPYVPGQSSFLYFNLTTKPTFFGCDASNLTALVKDGVVPPLVIYMANRPYEYFSNTSTFKFTYTDNQKKGMVANGFDIASRNNMTQLRGHFLDETDEKIETDAETAYPYTSGLEPDSLPNWQTCVGCAIVRRAEERSGVRQSDPCKKCFQHYCWDGRVYEDAAYRPPVNFTDDGYTNEPMVLDKHNVYVHQESPTNALTNKLFPWLSKNIPWWPF
ncbi:hypothetical protein METBIDRAFT_29559 [Metschnikowia bicuspidata var. bicuspidata NRRL YB-4993]|uniref:Lysophospholipase n=1 Tax=Metschnikowia bicuspidata var. bicuspidata NRRL YB-4993 TaxID=869754 RepID=A0A1A0HFS9_9ASCO|nr:hypothetical protein METBIDRAFT_29559 [Metschnikowia bicuspidata var. bicuspidata NRRL YB-4993]OBA23014.1 hypothetical protein METBIDRAFT_29559 [Metschnikowia bicuspidata var. bicuspidata NRRL YB-4993]